MKYDNEKFLGVECSVYNNGDEYSEESVELINFDIEQYKKALVKDYLSMQRTTFISEFDSFESAYYGMYYGIYEDYDKNYKAWYFSRDFSNDYTNTLEYLNSCGAGLN